MGCTVNILRRSPVDKGTHEYKSNVLRPTKLLAYEIFLRCLFIVSLASRIRRAPSCIATG